MSNTRYTSADLFTAAKSGYIQIVKKILAFESQKNPDGLKKLINAQHNDLNAYITPLCVAINNGYLEIVEVLLNAGADVNQAEGEVEKYFYPLHVAVFQYDNERNQAKKTRRFKIIKILTEKGANYNLPDFQHRPPLDYYLDDNSPYPFLRLRSINPYDYKIKTLLRSNYWDDEVLCPTLQPPWVNHFMHSFYKEKSDGYCAGISNAAEESVLIQNGFSQFNRRLKRTYFITLTAMYDTWNELTLVSLPRNDEELEKIWEEKVKENIQKIIQTPLNKGPLKKLFELVPIAQDLTELGNELINIRALAEKIQIYQLMQYYPNLILEEHKDIYQNYVGYGRHPFIRNASDIVESLDLSKKGGRITAFRFSAIYTKDTLTGFFTNLRQVFDTEIDGKQFPHPVSISFITAVKGRHTFNVSFDEKNKQWIFIDINGMLYVPADKGISQVIFSRYSVNEKIDLRGNIYVAAYSSEKEAAKAARASLLEVEGEKFKGSNIGNIEKIRPFIDYWQQIEKSFAVTKSKVAEKTGGYTLRKIAIEHGQPNEANKYSKYENEINGRIKTFFSQQSKELLVGTVIGLGLTGIMLAITAATTGADFFILIAIEAIGGSITNSTLATGVIWAGIGILLSAALGFSLIRPSSKLQAENHAKRYIRTADEISSTNAWLRKKLGPSNKTISNITMIDCDVSNKLIQLEPAVSNSLFLNRNQNSNIDDNNQSHHVIQKNRKKW